jgi:tRNA threonylcarbamoyladenosine biosynthesis protein TsaE
MVTEKTRVVTRSAEETRQLGEGLGRRLVRGDVVAFIGDLGSGKTTMIQGVCRGLGVSEVVNSPTFTIVNEYRGRIPVYHLDCYRLDGIEDLIGLGYEEYVFGDGACLIEWAEKAQDLLPRTRIEVRLTRADENSRTIIITAVNGDEDPVHEDPGN